MEVPQAVIDAFRSLLPMGDSHVIRFKDYGEHGRIDAFSTICAGVRVDILRYNTGYWKQDVVLWSARADSYYCRTKQHSNPEAALREAIPSIVQYIQNKVREKNLVAQVVQEDATAWGVHAEAWAKIITDKP